MTHCTSTTLAPKLVCSAGKATFTTVLSMKAMLDARIVVVSTQAPAAPLHGEVALWESITASSQGGLIRLWMYCAAEGVRRMTPGRAEIGGRLTWTMYPTAWRLATCIANSISRKAQAEENPAAFVPGKGNESCRLPTNSGRHICDAVPGCESHRRRSNLPQSHPSLPPVRTKAAGTKDRRLRFRAACGFIPVRQCHPGFLWHFSTRHTDRRRPGGGGHRLEFAQSTRR